MKYANIICVFGDHVNSRAGSKSMILSIVITTTLAALDKLTNKLTAGLPGQTKCAFQPLCAIDQI